MEAVEAGRELTDDWLLQADRGRYDLWVYGPNGFVREFRGSQTKGMRTIPDVNLEYDVAKRSVTMVVTNEASRIIGMIHAFGAPQRAAKTPHRWTS